MPTPHRDLRTLFVFEHPLIQHKLTRARDKTTGFSEFRALLGQIAGLMTYEVTRTFPAVDVDITTPMEPMTGRQLDGSITVCPVLRAGLGMAEGVLDLLPEARLGHIGLVRDDSTLQPKTYLSKLPRNLDAGPVLLVDPMLATGGSAIAAAELLATAGAADIRFICLVASPEGVKRFSAAHPDVPIYAAALDDRLDDNGYILPGLGDAGDRLYGTG
jgi:uracil phosphoribosyltransferase